MVAETVLHDYTVKQLVDRFIAVALAQHDASMNYQTTRYNRLFDQMTEIEKRTEIAGE